ncbi:MAG: hypothetical protein WCC39_00430 [Telluria sp.]
MHRLTLLIACLAATMSHACFAADTAACTAACASEQRACQGGAQPRKERLMAASRVSDVDAHAQGAQFGQLRGHNVLGTDNSVSSFKRLSQAGACEADFKQCARDCGPAPEAGVAGKGGPQDKQGG